MSSLESLIHGHGSRGEDAWLTLGSIFCCYLLGFKEKDVGSRDQNIQGVPHMNGLGKSTGWGLGHLGRRKWHKPAHCRAAKPTWQLPYICQVPRSPCWWEGNWGTPQGSEWGQRSVLVEAEAGWKHLRLRISRCFRTYQVYRAARFWVFMGVPLLRCWERCDWFRPVTSTTSLWGMLCCCM